MAVAVERGVLLVGDMNDGEDYSQNSRQINADEHVMQNHDSRSLSMFRKRAGLGISEVDSGRTSVFADRPLVWLKAN